MVNTNYSTSGKQTLIELLIAFFIVFCILYWTYTTRNSNIIEMEQNFRNAQEVHCPSSFKEVIGDEFSSFDHLEPLTWQKVIVKEVKNEFIYTDKNISHSMWDCNIKY